MAQKEYINYFEELNYVVVDEWHELLGSKRGVQVELALSRMKGICKQLCVWGISATIGNMEEAMQVLQGVDSKKEKPILIRSTIPKRNSSGICFTR